MDKLGMTESNKDNEHFTNCLFYAFCMNEADQTDWNGRTCSQCSIYIEDKGLDE